MVFWDQNLAIQKIYPVMQGANLRSYTETVTPMPDGTRAILKLHQNGLRVRQHKNTWKRKRETGYLVCIEYFIKGERLFYHVEPWVNYPSDYLVAKLMLLPPEVK